MTAARAEGRLLPQLARHGRLLFLAVLAIAYWLVLFGIAGIEDPGRPGRSLVRIAASLVELWFAGLLIAGCMRRASRAGRGRPAWLALAAAIAAAVCLGMFAQSASLAISGNLLTPLALQNGDSAGFVLSPTLGIAAAAFGWWLLFCATLLLPRPRPVRRFSLNGEAIRPALFAASLVIAGLLVAYLLTLQRKGPALEPGFRQTPLAGLAVALHDAWRGRRQQEEIESAIAAACPPLPAPASDIPFLRTRIYRQPLPRRAGAPRGKPNAIVFMAEGVSARMLGAYGGRYPGLTPNLDRLARQAMRVDNYFNHTAATYRGVGGQLFSGFAAAGGAGKGGWERVDDPAALTTTRHQTVPMLLSDAGWDTYFLAPHGEDRPFIVMLRSLGFDHVLSRDSIGADLLGGHARMRQGIGALEDQSLFTGLRRLLERRQAAPASKPFFIALYNIGTHAFIKPGPVRYAGSDNPVVNKLHNLDAAFGEFLDWFEASPYAANTVLVFTADHATYPEPAYRKAAGPGLKPYFVDRIPLLVLDPMHRLPKTKDAGGRTSLSFAPTLLQLLDAPQADNAFLGRSLFEPRARRAGIAWTGPGNYYLTTRDGVFGAGEIPPALGSAFTCGQALVRRYFRAEQENRIFPENPATR